MVVVVSKREDFEFDGRQTAPAHFEPRPPRLDHNNMRDSASIWTSTLGTPLALQDGKKARTFRRRALGNRPQDGRDSSTIKFPGSKRGFQLD